MAVAPNSSNAKHLLALCYHHLGNYRAAYEALEQVNTVQACYLAGVCAGKIGKAPDAITRLMKALEGLKGKGQKGPVVGTAYLTANGCRRSSDPV